MAVGGVLVYRGQGSVEAIAFRPGSIGDARNWTLNVEKVPVYFTDRVE